MRMTAAAANFDAHRKPLPVGVVLRAREDHRARLLDAVRTALTRGEAAGRFAFDDVALRLGKTPDELTAMLATPETLTLDDVSDILTAASLKVGFISIAPGA